MKISAIVPVYNRAGLMPKLIQALLNQDYPVEIVIVDDGSTDNTADIVRGFPVTYIHQKNSGPSAARNHGVNESGGDIVVFTDSDCVPQKDWIRRLIDGFEDDVGAVAGSYNIANPESLLASCIHEEIKLRHLALKRKKYIRAFGSYNVALKRNVFLKVGGFNEGYRSASGEDNDLSYKILKAGYKIRFKDDALVAHHHPEQIWNYLKEQYRHGYWRIKMYRDFPEMSRGDDYMVMKDIIEVPLALFSLCSILFLWNKNGAFLFSVFTLSNAILQVKTAITLIRIKKSYKFIYLSIIMFLRSYARALGAVRGILKLRPLSIHIWNIKI